MIDPFVIDGPAVISFSGGRTSAYMLRRILDAHGGTLPEDVHALFANTGREMDRTLDFVQACSEHWGVPIVWLEYRGEKPFFAEVTHATASRDGEPFSALIRKRGTVPRNNPGWRFCTSELKVKTFKRWMKARGYKEWTNVLGLRADEPRRVANATAPRESEPWENIAPLARAGITKPQIVAWWSEQPFDLGLQPFESNCDLCFMKGRAQIDRMMRAHPERAEWWMKHEAETGRRFRLLEPPYAVTLAQVRASPMLPGLGLDGDEEGLPCGCTD